jgi:MoaA/NifB/PqqE/SkfB family radical SAM enzyme
MAAAAKPTPTRTMLPRSDGRRRDPAALAATDGPAGIDKKAGCAVGTTTDGTLLDDRAVGEFVASRLDVLAISLAGIEERNDVIRQGARLQQVPDALRRLDAAKEALRAHGKELHYRLLQPGATPGPCTENVERSLFVSVTGVVSPCVFTNLPLPGETAAAACCDRSFGYIHDASVGRFWRSGGYRAFRTAFRAGRVPPVCVDCPKAVAT